MNRPCPCLRCRERRWRPPWGLAGSDPRAPVPPANGASTSAGHLRLLETLIVSRDCRPGRRQVHAGCGVEPRGSPRGCGGTVEGPAATVGGSAWSGDARRRRVEGVRGPLKLEVQCRSPPGRTETAARGSGGPRTRATGRARPSPAASARASSGSGRRFLHSRGTSRMLSAPARSAATNPTTRSGGSCDRIPASG